MTRHVVAIGGGHGLAASLRAVAGIADHVTAVVSTADDGGSTGRLRESWDVPALGDVRRCLAALAPDGGLWPRVLERRFDAGELTGHAVGNLLLLALTEELGDLQSACDEVAHTCGLDPTRARVVPVTDDAVVLHGRTTDGTVVEGQVAVAEATGVHEVWVEPSGTAASTVAIQAIRGAEQVVLGPGSLYTSLLAALVVGDLRHALADTPAQVVYVANLRAEQPEVAGYDVAAHVDALVRHGVTPDVVLAQPGALPLGLAAAKVVELDLADPGGRVHDPVALGAALASVAP